MKNLSVSLILLAATLFCLNACDTTGTGEQQEPPASDSTAQAETEAAPTSGYDSLKAKAYGADDYGMRKYVIAFLKKGPNREQDSVKAAELQIAHMKNISRLAEENKLVLAGPFFGDGEMRGIYVFAVNSIEEAQALTNTDPAVQSGSLEMELKEWYGSAALMGLNEVHASLSKSEITD
ncbi:YciI family protein [Roseivirga sp. BDSF3-8]|uniref:YciI family protein n=1 Tax=Roseivirga sp. BDSF3-8 TaxID=3241598 RepID=UPI003532242D